MLDFSNCIRSMSDPAPNDSNAGCVAVVRAEWLGAKYKEPKYQLFRLGGGFGTSPSKMGNCCIGYFCADGEQCRMERYDLLGIADEATTKMAEELEAAWKK